MIRSHRKNIVLANQYFAIFGGGTDQFGGASAGEAAFYTPKALEISDATIHVPTAPGAGKSVTLRIDQGGTPGANSIVLSDAEVSEKGALDVSIPVTTSVLNNGSGIHFGRLIPSGSPSAVDAHIGIVYQHTDIPGLVFFASGDSASNFAVGATDEFRGIDSRGTVGATTDALARAVVSVPGRFKFARCRYSTGSDNAYTATLMINGIASAIVLALPTSTGGALVDDGTTEVAVVAGDFVSWRFHRTAGTSTTIVAYCIVGFVAD